MGVTVRSLVVLIPVALVLIGVAVWGFTWAFDRQDDDRDADRSPGGRAAVETPGPPCANDQPASR